MMYGRLSKIKKQKLSWGTKRVLWTDWDELKTSGYVIDFKSQASYEAWANKNSENLCIVEQGSGILVFNGQSYPVHKKYVFKIFPGQEPVIKPKGKLTILSVQMPSTMPNKKRTGENMKTLKVINVDTVPSKVYEYETLGQEILTPKYFPGLGLIKFAFVNPIPIHRHPLSARLIRPISGKGFTFMEPNVYEAHADTFALFKKGIVHTNGNIPGRVLNLYAVQMPWIESGIDEEDIGGSPRFVKYVGVTPPKQLWKKKPDFVRLIKLLKK